MSERMGIGEAWDIVWANIGIGCWDDKGIGIPRHRREHILEALGVLQSLVHASLERPPAEDMEALIQWLALPYAGDPVWAVEGDELTESRRRLQLTWEHVVGTKGPSGPGAWAECKCCGMWQVVAVLEGESIGG